MPSITITAPIPGSASNSACTTARICGTTDRMRRLRITRSALSARSAPVCGRRPRLTTMKSKMFQPERKKPRPLA